MNTKLIKAYALLKANLGGEELLEEYLSEELNIPLGEFRDLYKKITTDINNEYDIGLTDYQFRNLIYLEYVSRLSD